MDGTLLKEDKTISSQTEKALNTAANKGIARSEERRLKEHA
ncbi:MAG: HAD hydrolase family protein [Sporolactobacillus sp.]